MRQRNNQFALAFLLAFSGGYQDAYTYLLRGKVFANAQTGNIVLLAQRFVEGDFVSALWYLLPLSAFVAGVFVSEQLERRKKQPHILLIEIVLLAAVAWIPEAWNHEAAALVSFACAMQVQGFRTVSAHPYASTMCIGNIRSGTEALSAYVSTKDKEEGKKALLYGAIIVSFALGCAVSAVAAKRLSLASILVSPAVLSVVLLIEQAEKVERRQKKSGNPKVLALLQERRSDV